MRQLLRETSLDSGPTANQASEWVGNLTSIQTLAIFAPMLNEVDLTTMVNQYPHHRWVFPKVDGDLLTFHQIRNPDTELETGAFNILEPTAKSPEVEINDIDVFFCPGLAFDPSGGRIGRGRGFYDRMLAMARSDAHKIGVCFPEQLVPNTFPEDHDIIMDEVMSGV